MPIILPLRYSAMVSFILCNSFSVTEIPNSKKLSTNCYVSVPNFHQNTKSTTDLYIYSILEECLKAVLKMLLIDSDRLTLPRCLHVYLSKRVEGNINSFYICIQFNEKRPKDGWKMSLGYVRIIMFCGYPENVNLTHSITFINIIFKV